MTKKRKAPETAHIYLEPYKTVTSVESPVPMVISIVALILSVASAWVTTEHKIVAEADPTHPQAPSVGDQAAKTMTPDGYEKMCEDNCAANLPSKDLYDRTGGKAKIVCLCDNPPPKVPHEGAEDVDSSHAQKYILKEYGNGSTGGSR